MINKAQFKCLAVFSLFAIIGFGPVSVGCLIGMYVVIKRPEWFIKLVEDLYETCDVTVVQYPNYRLKVFFSILTLFIIDIAPVPVTPVIAFIIILSRPNWFYRIVKTVYSAS